MDAAAMAMVQIKMALVKMLGKQEREVLFETLSSLDFRILYENWGELSAYG